MLSRQARTDQTSISNCRFRISSPPPPFLSPTHPPIGYRPWKSESGWLRMERTSSRQTIITQTSWCLPLAKLRNRSYIIITRILFHVTYIKFDRYVYLPFYRENHRRYCRFFFNINSDDQCALSIIAYGCDALKMKILHKVQCTGTSKECRMLGITRQKAKRIGERCG